MTQYISNVPDYLRDFVYAKLAAAVGTGDTTITVDDTSEFPANSDIAGYNFWMTIESPLTHPNSFEIVRVTGIDTSSNTLTVVRGERSGISAHDSGMYIKSTVSALMLNQLAFGMGGYGAPNSGTVANPNEGQRYYDYSGHQPYYFNGTSWEPTVGSGGGSGGGGGLAIPTTSSSMYFNWPTSNDVKVTQNYSPVTQPLSAGMYSVTTGIRPTSPQINGGAEDFAYSIQDSLYSNYGAKVVVSSDMTFIQTATVVFTGLNEGDRVGVAGQPNEYLWDYADSDGNVTISCTLPIATGIAGTQVTVPDCTVKLFTTSTVVYVSSMSVSMSMVEGTPTGTNYVPYEPDNFVGGATDLTSSMPSVTETWSLDNYGSIEPIVCAPTPSLGNNGVYNPRWFQVQAATDGNMTIDVSASSGDQMAVAIWGNVPPSSGYSSTVAFDDSTSDGTNTGSSTVTFAVYSGTMYYMAVGTKVLSIPNGVTVNATITGPAAPAAAAVNVVGATSVGSAGSMDSSITFPSDSQHLVLAIAFSCPNGTTPTQFGVTVGNPFGSTTFSAQLFAYDSHVTGEDTYGVGYWVTSGGTGGGTQTLSNTASDVGMVIEGAVAVFLQNDTNSYGTSGTTFCTTAAYDSGTNLAQDGHNSTIGPNDLGLFCSASVAGLPSVITGSVAATSGNLQVMTLTSSAEAATVQWTGDHNNESSFVYLHAQA